MEGFKEDPSKLCKQENPQAFYGQNIGLIGFSSKGESHKKNNLPGQDANYIKVVNPNHNTVVASIADGVGSSSLSHYGSSIATKVATDYLARIFHTTDIRSMKDKEIAKHIREAMRRAREAVKKEAEDQEVFEYAYQSTLTTAIYDGDKLYFGHIGDDGIVALNKKGQLELVTLRHKGDEASSVYPLQAREDMYQVGRVDDVDGFVMATDGVLDAFVKSEHQGNRVYWPFIEPALKGNPGQERKTPQDFCRFSQDMLNVMNSKKIRDSITDDITFVACMNTERIKHNPYRFDAAKWKEMDDKYAKEVYEALYGKNNNSTSRSPKPQISASQVGAATKKVNPEDKAKASGILGRAKDKFNSFMKGGKND